MIVLLTLPRTGSESYYNEHIVTPNPGWVHLHEPPSWIGPQFEQAYKLLTTRPKSSVKIFPIFENGDHRKSLMSIIEHADEVIYNFREDFQPQCKSYMISNITQHWGNNKTEQVIDLDSIDEQVYRQKSMELLLAFLDAELIYEQFPGKVVLLESREQKPYNNPYIYKGNWPNIDDILYKFEWLKSRSKLFN
jgi:hypothetical protein